MEERTAEMPTSIWGKHAGPEKEEPLSCPGDTVLLSHVVLIIDTYTLIQFSLDNFRHLRTILKHFRRKEYGGSAIIAAVSIWYRQTNSTGQGLK